MLTLESATLDDLDLGAAVDAELADPPRLLPSRVLNAAIKAHRDEYVEHLASLVQRPLRVSQQDLLWASKSRLGHRPLSVLPLQERVIYRALVGLLAPRLSDFDKRRMSYADFEQYPLGFDGAKYIASADVAAYYQYVDHSLLAARIVESAGRADVARALSSFLQLVFQRHYGLPQDNRASDVLGELYIVPVERGMIRAGLWLSRFNDDFRISTVSVSGGYAAIERLQTELQALGLTLNEEKTRVRGIEKYRRGLGEVDRRMREKLAAHEVDLTRYNEYTGEPIDPDPDEVQEAILDATTRAGADLYWDALERLKDPSSDALERLTSKKLLQVALSILSQGRSGAVVGHGTSLLATDPSLAQAYANYLTGLAQSGGKESAGEEAATLLATDGYAPAWQRLWMMQPFLVGGADLPESVAKFLAGYAKSDAPSIVRARAILLLAAKKLITDGTAAKQIERMPPVAAPDLVAAVGVANRTNDAVVNAVRGERPEAAWILNEVTEPGHIFDGESWM